MSPVFPHRRSYQSRNPELQERRHCGCRARKDWSGIHHIGFQVESLEEATSKLQKSGVKRRYDINVALGLGAGGAPAGHGNVEVRYIGPDNVNFDVSETGWVGTPSNKARHG